MVSTTRAAGSACGGPDQRDRDLHGRQRRPRVALARRHDGVDGVLLRVRPLRVEPAPHQRAQVVGAEGVQPPQRGPAQQGRIHLEEGVLRGRPDEHHQPVLDGGQQHVLLGLGEPVHLVDEEHRALAVLAQAAPGLGQRLPHVLHAGGRGREGDEVLGRGVRQQVGECRLPRAGGAPQDRRAHPVGLGQHPQRGAGADEVLLAHDLIERAGPEASRERRLALQLAVRRVGEEAHGPAAPS